MGGYVFQPFPKCKYHPDGSCRVVADAGAERDLGPEWVDRPVPAPVPVVLPAPPEPPPEGPESRGLGADASIPLAPAPRRRGRPRKERPA